jgi:Domain of unknown function (DUF4168)
MTRLSTATLLAAALSMGCTLPLAAQQQPRAGGATPPGTAGAPPVAGSTISDATIAKTGAALQQLSGIQRDYYAQRAQAAPEQRQALEEQANRAARQAINGQGLSVDEFNRVMQLAQADDGVRQRVMAAANSAR